MQKNKNPFSFRPPARRFPWLWVAVLAWAGLIFYFSAQPSLSTGWGVWDYFLRKGAHMTEFGILAFLLWRAIRQHVDADRLAMTLAAVTALLYACSDEYHQSFVNGRTATVRDVGFDLTGILLAVVFTAGVYRHLNRSDSGFGWHS